MYYRHFIMWLLYLKLTFFLERFVKLYIEIFKNLEFLFALFIFFLSLVFSPGQ